MKTLPLSLILTVCAVFLAAPAMHAETKSAAKTAEKGKSTESAEDAAVKEAQLKFKEASKEYAAAQAKVPADKAAVEAAKAKLDEAKKELAAARKAVVEAKKSADSKNKRR